MAGRIWTRETIVAAIRAEAAAGHDLSYSSTERRVPSLIHAAQRTFGHWSSAVEAAGFDYSAIRRYRKWTRERVIKRIQELHAKGADLSWRSISLDLDPPLAAATLHAGRFASWAEALRAAGLDPDQIARYRRWTPRKIQDELERLACQGVPLDQETLNQHAPALIAAIYRIGRGLVAEREALEKRLTVLTTPAEEQAVEAFFLQMHRLERSLTRERTVD